MNLIEQKEQVSLTELRKLSYEILKNVFYTEPADGFIGALAQTNVLEELPFSDESEGIAQGRDLIMGELAQGKTSAVSYFEALHWDYTRLFVGPNYLLAAPFESTYFNDSRLIFQEQTFEVRQEYLNHQFIPKHYPVEPDDHIGCELDFMARLCTMSQEALDEGDEDRFGDLLKDQHRFLNCHLGRWSDLFAEQVEEHAHSGFYRGFAQILKNFVVLDETWLEEQLSLIGER